MTALDIATELVPTQPESRTDRPADGDLQRFTTTLSPSWGIWGPMGGYVASVALRAAGLACGRARPASVSVQFHGVGTYEPVDVTTRILRSTRVATSVEVDLVQRGRTIMRATVWGVDELPGLEHHTERQPDAPSHVGLPNMDQRFADAGVERSTYEFWKRVEQRPLDWIADWDTTPPGEPIARSWNRFVDAETHADAWTDACRLLTITDIFGWICVGPAHRMSDVMEHFYAPTIELTTRFVGDARDEPWLLVDAEAPVAAGGVIIHRGEVWTSDGRLVAQGGSTLLCRPTAQQPA